MSLLTELRIKLRVMAYADEERCIKSLLMWANQDKQASKKISELASDLVGRSRKARDKRRTLDAFLEEFGLATHEGVALMCLAEALLRIPDDETIDALIAEKVQTGDWLSHKGHSDSLYVNASTWGMMLTGKIVELDKTVTLNTVSWFKGVVSRLGEVVVRQAMLQAMRIMGQQYVLGRTIEEAMKRGPAENAKATRFSYDMLGEGARTERDAQQYFSTYQKAITAISKSNSHCSVIDSDGISIKLSALCAQYKQSKKQSVVRTLYPKLRQLAVLAKDGNMGINIDAEEAERLDLSLDLFEMLARDPELKDWNGLGFVLQAYQKRAVYVADWLIELARETGQRFMVRLVKGAYWDAEIKHAQVLGLQDYPVYTRKENTDLSYQVCARKLFAAQNVIFPQFATHNAHTIAMVMVLADNNKVYEFQRLHGMGQLLYSQLLAYCQYKNIPVPPQRVYAPVGGHRDLLPYLVRRLLENGANSSFVNRFLNEKTPIQALAEDVLNKVNNNKPKRHPSISLPKNIYLDAEVPRVNSAGINLEDINQATRLSGAVTEFLKKSYKVGPIIEGRVITAQGDFAYSPANRDVIVGSVKNATEENIATAINSAALAQAEWDFLGGYARAEIVERIASLLNENGDELITLISREAGRTLNDGLAELREAIDFCYYYAGLAKQHFAQAKKFASPTGESNALSMHGRGVFLCISPWNFPLSIFVGQVVAALVAGNSVIAKPAEQTPIIAFEVVRLMHQAGVPSNVLHLITGVGRDIGPLLIKNEHIQGVAFTGSTDTAKLISRQLAERDGPIVPLIAETGGLNAMIADSSCLPEQLVDDVIASAFMSAGQRCSALRVLFLQEDIADKVLEMLKGACDELQLSEPWDLSTDIGPVIDKKARSVLNIHAEKMRKEAIQLYEYPKERMPSCGNYFGPKIYQIENMGELQREVFGPILHIVRFKGTDIDHVIGQINNCGYGLTLGVHSRIENRVNRIFNKTAVGNTYVNRNMVGAVVGVNPFGGQGLSGTGPKAGGPHYLFRFATEKTLTINTAASGGNIDLYRSMDNDQA